MATFDLDVNHAHTGFEDSENTNTILTILIAALRRNRTMEVELSQYEGVASVTKLNAEVLEWLEQRKIEYQLGIMRITIPEEDAALEFKLRWM